jgi:hypothetical protein
MPFGNNGKYFDYDNEQRRLVVRSGSLVDH